jgi:hypothetical protein
LTTGFSCSISGFVSTVACLPPVLIALPVPVSFVPHEQQSTINSPRPALSKPVLPVPSAVEESLVERVEGKDITNLLERNLTIFVLLVYHQ